MPLLGEFEAEDVVPNRPLRFNVVGLAEEGLLLFLDCNEPVLCGRPLRPLPLTLFEDGLSVSGFEDNEPEDGIEAKLFVPVKESMDN